VRKFWTGMCPSLIRSVSACGVFFGSVDLFRNSKVLNNLIKDSRYQSVNAFMVGSISKLFADTVSYPFGLIKVKVLCKFKLLYTLKYETNKTYHI